MVLALIGDTERADKCDVVRRARSLMYMRKLD